MAGRRVRLDGLRHWVYNGLCSSPRHLPGLSMQTATIICPECKGQIAVSRDDLGHSVQCPLCSKVILASERGQGPPVPPPASPFEPVFQPSQAQEPESIFAPPEAASEDVFGETRMPQLEIPPAEHPPQLLPATLSPPAPATPSPRDFSGMGLPPSVTFEPGDAPPPSAAGPASEAPTELMGSDQIAPLVNQISAQRAAPASEARRLAARESQLVPLLLIFLIPYAIFTTAFIAYLLYTQNQNSVDPLLDRLPDPAKGDGGPRRIKHDLPVPNQLKTNLRQPVQIGDVEVKPLRVELRAEGDLCLHLHVKNLSKDTEFSPIPESFGRYLRGSLTAARPYTFLEVGDKRAYGCYVEWWQGSPGTGKAMKNRGVLRPGEDQTVVLITDMKDRPVLAGLQQADHLFWRVHVRRGFVQVNGKDISATCVIGVRFTAKDIQRGAQPLAEPAENESRQTP